MSSTASRLPRGPRLPRDGARTSSPTPTTSSPLVSRGGTARAAVPPRVTGGAIASPVRRSSSVRGTPPPHDLSSDRPPSREALTASLKRETEEKEDLIVRIQNHEQTITELKAENANFGSALNAAETRLAELYAEQARMEEDLASRMDVIEKLRTQVRELEKEKRDALRRYNEQTQTFDAERQSFYDNEQHLKLRIQTLSQARRSRAASLATTATDNDTNESPPPEEHEPYDDRVPESPQHAKPQRRITAENEPAEMTALRLELSTLSTSQASLQNTLLLLQNELLDLKRVNNELQEENESYNILLTEKTLSGQIGIMRHRSESPEEEDDDPVEREGRAGMKNTTLDMVSEMDEMFESAPSPLAEELRAASLKERDASPSSRASGRSSRKPRLAMSIHNETTDQAAGENLGDLPVAGPGLDLAAELGRAVNKDILEGGVAPPDGSGEGSSNVPKSAKDDQQEKVVAALRSEVKSLKDANKALSLYASKIIDRIIAQDGFEHVLAVDYAEPNERAVPPSPVKPRPQSLLFFSGSSKKESKPQPKPQPAVQPTPAPEQPPQDQIKAAPAVKSPPSATPEVKKAASPVLPASAPERPGIEKRTRRALSMDWKAFNFFGGGSTSTSTPSPPEKKSPSPSPALAPVPVPTARKLHTEEDEEDRRERERLHATMKLMGIEPAAPNTNLMKNLSSTAPSAAGNRAPLSRGDSGETPQGFSISELGEIKPDPERLALRHKRGLSSVSSGVSTVWSVGREHDAEGEGDVTIEAHYASGNTDSSRVASEAASPQP
ncbi:hypothetical protein BOTBODRAFT_27355 [Botryobasidium botryosum FD-172 SS1]|uniref:Uncharacterized protein n=1 Tax=Botryobasidium botryosum (strain FD-172 SS1) TaxID=930990 RepID=A0A067MWG3_BOTB1|nr:hypothetical protein BOTBODRAFT_27355 [Botryobasidium botryosum FD-172 SS1]